MPPASDDLVRTRALFEQWRAARQGRSKIPDELWEAVVALHGRYSASQLCRELHLSAGGSALSFAQGKDRKTVVPSGFRAPACGRLRLVRFSRVVAEHRRDPSGVGARRRYVLTLIFARFAVDPSRSALYGLPRLVRHVATGAAATDSAGRRTGRFPKRD